MRCWSKHCFARMLNLISAILSQLPCLGGVVKLKTLENSPSLSWRELFVERLGHMSVEIIHHDHDLLRIRECFIDERFHLKSKVILRSSVGDVDMTPGQQRSKEHKQVANPFTFVSAVMTFQLCRLRWNGDNYSSIDKSLFRASTL